MKSENFEEKDFQLPSKNKPTRGGARNLRRDAWLDWEEEKEIENEIKKMVESETVSA